MSRSYNINNNFGVRSANDLLKLANGNGKTKPILPSQESSSSGSTPSRSKILKRFAIHLIRFCLKSDITENKNIIKFLQENKVVLKRRTFDRYKNIAQGLVENDSDADIWLSEKASNAVVHDFKDISDRYDRQLFLDDLLMEGLIRQAMDEALEKQRDPNKYYRYLDVYSIIRLQETSNQTMKNKWELISKGPVMYKIKKYIDNLQAENGRKYVSDPTEQNRRLLDLFNRSILFDNDKPLEQKRLKEKEKEQERIVNANPVGDEKESGFQLAEHLKFYEQKLGKKLSTLEH